MNKKLKFILPVIFIAGFISLLAFYLKDMNLAIFNPKGEIAAKQRDLIYFTVALSLLVVVPVFSLTLFIGYRYRATNTKAKYTPEWDHSPVMETIWWGIPIAIIGVLSIVTWNSTYALDPFKPLESKAKPLTIQVVAMEWKWLFIYPEQNIASVNFAQIPTDRPVNFMITSDAPMNSFWVPQLGGQIYAMSGMQTQLHLIADEEGMYNGSSANLSGEGFAGMTFKVAATSQSDFNNWVDESKQINNPLTTAAYDDLAVPSQNNVPIIYSEVTNGLFASLIAKYDTHHAAMNMTEDKTYSEVY